MSPGHKPTDEEARHSAEVLLGAVETGGDIFDALEEVRPLHPKDNTFPGEVFVALAADALAEGGVSRDQPVSEDALGKRYLPECQFRGRDNRQIRYAVLAAAAVHGGVELDLLEEVAYWASDDFWTYAGLAAVAWARAVADQRNIPLTDLCTRLRARASTAKHDGT